MSTFTKIYYHIIFSTKQRRPFLVKEGRPDLYRYIWGLLKNKQCHLYRINGTEDHIHILCSLHPSISLAELVKTIKVATSLWIKEKKLFWGFDQWQTGYGAFTCSHNEKNSIIEYIKNQEEHHKKFSFIDEYKRLLDESAVKYEDTFL
jgi:putative transposase